MFTHLVTERAIIYHCAQARWHVLCMLKVDSRTLSRTIVEDGMLEMRPVQRNVLSRIIIKRRVMVVWHRVFSRMCLIISSIMGSCVLCTTVYYNVLLRVVSC